MRSISPCPLPPPLRETTTHNSAYRSDISPVKPIYFRPFIRVLTPFITTRGPPSRDSLEGYDLQKTLKLEGVKVLKLHETGSLPCLASGSYTMLSKSPKDRVVPLPNDLYK